MSVVLVVLEAVEQLTQLFESENVLFRSQPPRAVSQALMQHEPEKRRLAIAYERAMATLKAKPVPAGPERDRLKGAIERFRAVMEEHRRRLNALRLVTERLVKAIGEAAQGPMKPVQTYNASAVMRTAFRAKPVAQPLALNRTI